MAGRKLCQAEKIPSKKEEEKPLDPCTCVFKYNLCMCNPKVEEKREISLSAGRNDDSGS